MHSQGCNASEQLSYLTFTFLAYQEKGLRSDLFALMEGAEYGQTCVGEHIMWVEWVCCILRATAWQHCPSLGSKCCYRTHPPHEISDKADEGRCMWPAGKRNSVGFFAGHAIRRRSDTRAEEDARTSTSLCGAHILQNPIRVSREEDHDVLEVQCHTKAIIKRSERMPHTPSNTHRIVEVPDGSPVAMTLGSRLEFMDSIWSGEWS